MEGEAAEPLWRVNGGEWRVPTCPAFYPLILTRQESARRRGNRDFLVRVTFEIRRNDKSNTRKVGPIARRVSRDEGVAAYFRMCSDVEIG